MTHSLKGKLILSYLAVALVTIAIVVIVTQVSSNQSLMDMFTDQQVAQLSDSVSAYYTSNASLDGFLDYYLNTQFSAPPQQNPGNFTQAPGRGTPRGIAGLADASGRAILPSFGYDIGEMIPAERLKDAETVRVNGEVVAYILRDPVSKTDLKPEEQRYIQSTRLAIGLAALVGVGTAVLLGVLLAGGINKPVRKLTEASARMAQGELGKQLPVTSQDELGQLTRSFNQMSADLARGDAERKRLTADITHDLSTPLQIISGYVEMLEDGEVQMTPERLGIIKTEIEHLRRLVGDLTTLSQAEAGGLDIQKSLLDPAQLLETIYATYLPIAARQGVALGLEAPIPVCPVEVDEGRMLQVLKNLLENALRYTPAGGSIRLRVEQDEKVRLMVIDSGAGIDAEDLPYIFERFYQADKARPANRGKMGLGLAICKALTTAQGCSIEARSGGKDQGTTIVVSIACAAAPES
jgi:Signal transduction histidine kinase